MKVICNKHKICLELSKKHDYAGVCPHDRIHEKKKGCEHSICDFLKHYLGENDCFVRCTNSVIRKEKLNRLSII